MLSEIRTSSIENFSRWLGILERTRPVHVLALVLVLTAAAGLRRHRRSSATRSAGLSRPLVIGYASTIDIRRRRGWAVGISPRGQRDRRARPGARPQT
jgi:hypothetical protein